MNTYPALDSNVTTSIGSNGLRMHPMGTPAVLSEINAEPNSAQRESLIDTLKGQFEYTTGLTLLAMNKKAISERLRNLAANDEKRPKSARLRDLMDDVEAALAAGVSREDVRAELAASGLVMSAATFQTTLKRLRAKRRRLPPSFDKSPNPPHKPPSGERNEYSQQVPSVVDLDRIIRDTPDMDALAKAAKKGKQK